MSDDSKMTPGVVYVGRDGSERLLVDRGEPTTNGKFLVTESGTTLRWRRPSGKAVRECWISTWLEWCKGAKP